MEINKKFEGFFEIIPSIFEDERGTLSRLYDKKIFEKNNLNTNWVQESISHTNNKYTLRGLHYQFEPNTECKLIRATRGKMLWVVVDLRKNSGTFGKWSSVVLSESKKNLIYVERGFAHGCISLENNCDLVIKSDNFYSPDKGVGIIWNDTDLKINWDLEGNEPKISEKDKKYITFEELKKILENNDAN